MKAAAGKPGAFGSSDAPLFDNGAKRPTGLAATSSLTQVGSTLHPVWGTLASEKFTGSMKPASASVYPGENIMAGVAGDFDKAYLPKPIERSTHSGRPLLSGETPLPAPPARGLETFHETVRATWPSDDETYEKPYMVRGGARRRAM